MTKIPDAKSPEVDLNIILPYLLDKERNCISYNQWESFKDNDSYKIIGLHKNEYLTVSTIWTGMSYDQSTIFESVIFDENSGFGLPLHAIWDYKYHTEKEALHMHERLCIVIDLACQTFKNKDLRRNFIFTMLYIMQDSDANPECEFSSNLV